MEGLEAISEFSPRYEQSCEARYGPAFFDAYIVVRTTAPLPQEGWPNFQQRKSLFETTSSTIEVTAPVALSLAGEEASLRDQGLP